MRYTLHLKNMPITDEELKCDVIRVANLIAPEPLSSKKYNELGKYNSDTVARRFGQRKWNEALNYLGLQVAQVFHSEKDLFDNIANVWLAKMQQPVRRIWTNIPLLTYFQGHIYANMENGILHFRSSLSMSKIIVR